MFVRIVCLASFLRVPWGAFFPERGREKCISLSAENRRLKKKTRNVSRLFVCVHPRPSLASYRCQVTHSPLGKVILEAFVVDICKAPTDWNMSDIAEEFIKEVGVVVVVGCW